MRGRRIAFAVLALIALGSCGYGRDPGTVQCTPGERIEVGCASACGLGACTGDPVLRVCDGEADVRECADVTAVLGENDDACGTLCPLARLECPASGRITVVYRAFAGDDATCDWDVRPARLSEEEQELPPLPIDAGLEVPGDVDAGTDVDAGAP